MNKFSMVTAFTLLAAMPIWQVARAQAAAPAPAQVSSQAANRHAAGLLMEHRGNEKDAFVAFLEAAEAGYPPAQRRLGEIYDTGNTAVERNYEESIRWYQKARAGGETIPPPKSHAPNFTGP